MRETGPNKSWIDRLAAAAALACAIECSVLPVVVAFLPLAGLGFLTHPRAEVVILALVLGFGGFSMLRGRKKHGDARPGRLFAAAYLTLIFTHLVLEDAVHPALEIGAHLVAGLSLATAAFWNLRRLKQSDGHCCAHHDSHHQTSSST